MDKVSFKPVEAEIKIVDNSSENNYNTLKTNRLDGSFLVALLLERITVFQSSLKIIYFTQRILIFPKTVDLI